MFSRFYFLTLEMCIFLNSNFFSVYTLVKIFNMAICSFVLKVMLYEVMCFVNYRSGVLIFPFFEPTSNRVVLNFAPNILLFRVKETGLITLLLKICFSLVIWWSIHILLLFFGTRIQFVSKSSNSCTLNDIHMFSAPTFLESLWNYC